MSEDRVALERAAFHALAHLDGLDTAPVAARTALTALRRALNRTLPQSGTPAARVIDELVADTRGGISGTQSGRFYGWVIGGGLPAAIAADWLTSVWDQNAGIYVASPAAAVVEEIAGAWLLELFELPRESSFAFTTGTQMAHVPCLAAARSRHRRPPCFCGSRGAITGDGNQLDRGTLGRCKGMRQCERAGRRTLPRQTAGDRRATGGRA
jgi:hypothetical protein